MDILTEDNYVLYGAKYYDNPQCTSTEEFYEDLARFKNIKRYLRKYKKSGILRTQVIINHLIITTNMFGPIPTVRLLYLICKDYFHILVPFLIFLNMLPETITNVFEINTIYTTSFIIDPKIVEELRKIKD